MKTFVKILIALVLIIVLAIIGIIVWYNSSLSAVDKNSTEKVHIEIPIGSGADKIASILEENHLIKSKLAFVTYVKLNKVSNFQAGKYDLYKSMNVEELIKTLQTGKLYVENQLVLTFIEGKTIDWYAEKIAEETNNTKEQVYALLKNEEYINSLIEKYWFITDEIKNENIYYPLEGYLFPETYFFENKDVAVEKIFEDLLNQTDKVLSEYKEQIEQSNYTVHQLLSIASIIEKEGIHDEDRAGIASVIYNRLSSNMAIQSDVTTYYAARVEVGSRDLYVSELNSTNPYNTRGPGMEGKIPVGPISSISKASIDAALNPATTDYLFFVADKNGKIYFTKTSREHNEIITMLRQQGLWYEF